MLAGVGGEAGRGAGGVELGEVELPEAGVVVCAGVAGCDDVEDAGVVGRLGEQAESERAGLRGVVRVVGVGGGFEREVASERGSGGFGGVEQRGDGARGLVGADVEISGGADNSEDARVGSVDGVHDAGGSGYVVVRLDERASEYWTRSFVRDRL